MSHNEIPHEQINEDADTDEFFDSETELPPIEKQADLDTQPNTSVSSSLKALSLNTLNTPTRAYTPIYAVQFKLNPHGDNDNLLSNSRIFINAETAKKLCKQDPEYRRFKVCKTFKEAYKFSYEAEIESGKAPSIEQVHASLGSITNVMFSPSQDAQQLATATVAATSNQTANLDAEKLPFSAPKKPEVNELRLFVERDNFEKFSDKVTANPRFLISAGDAPVVVQVSDIFLSQIPTVKYNTYRKTWQFFIIA